MRGACVQGDGDHMYAQCARQTQDKTRLFIYGHVPLRLLYHPTISLRSSSSLLPDGLQSFPSSPIKSCREAVIAAGEGETQNVEEVTEVAHLLVAEAPLVVAQHQAAEVAAALLYPENRAGMYLVSTFLTLAHALPAYLRRANLLLSTRVSLIPPRID